MVRLRYGYKTTRISAPDNTVRYGPKTGCIYTVYWRKCSVFEIFTVRFRIVNDSVLIDLGMHPVLRSVYLILGATNNPFFEEPEEDDEQYMIAGDVEMIIDEISMLCTKVDGMVDYLQPSVAQLKDNIEHASSPAELQEKVIKRINNHWQREKAKRILSIDIH
jgi:hypothetical protein